MPAYAEAMELYVGTAGWTLPRQHSQLFPAPDATAKLSHLQRYAGKLRCVEINSSFHRPHRKVTWERWAGSTPEDFRFSVKVPKSITHIAKLVNTGRALLDFFDAIRGLGDKLGPLLVQLPPKLPFDESIARDFFTTLRELHGGLVVLEPRHASWFDGHVDHLLRSFEIARVAADPPRGSEPAGRPGGWSSFAYWRLHGVPRTYYSNYDEERLQTLAQTIQLLKGKRDSEVWVIFDNTASGCAAANAVWLQNALLNWPGGPEATQLIKPL